MAATRNVIHIALWLFEEVWVSALLCAIDPAIQHSTLYWWFCSYNNYSMSIISFECTKQSPSLFRLMEQFCFFLPLACTGESVFHQQWKWSQNLMNGWIPFTHIKHSQICSNWLLLYLTTTIRLVNATIWNFIVGPLKGLVHQKYSWHNLYVRPKSFKLPS